VAALCSHLPHLMHLEMELTRQMTNEALSILAGASERVRALELDISASAQATDAAVNALLKRSRALRSLKANDVRLPSDDALATAPHCRRLISTTRVG
jgi:post-segregation antitoxin (ccd killing protein)